MNVLFVHQNFPGQFVHWAPAAAAAGHQVVALCMRPGLREHVFAGVRVVPYTAQGRQGVGVHPWLRDMEVKLLRAEACLRAAQGLQAQGFVPDVVVAHPSWGEALLLKQLWPQAKLGLYAEFFYQSRGADVGFDPEFAQTDELADACRLQLKNLNHLAHWDVADAAICPTQWQAQTFPRAWWPRMAVVHDGVDTTVLRPNAEATFKAGRLTLTRRDEVVTFVARHLEPYRGFHVLMRALPELLAQRPNAQVVIVGSEGKGYGAVPSDGRSWKAVYWPEVEAKLTPGQRARVHFVGRLGRADFTRMLQVSRVHVYLSYPFVLSWSLLEAMSVGACVVACDTAPVKEVVTHGMTGRLVNFFDAPALVAEVCELLNDGARRVFLGAAARRHVQQHYDLRTRCLPKQLAWLEGLHRLEGFAKERSPTNHPPSIDQQAI